MHQLQSVSPSELCENCIKKTMNSTLLFPPLTPISRSLSPVIDCIPWYTMSFDSDAGIQHTYIYLSFNAQAHTLTLFIFARTTRTVYVFKTFYMHGIFYMRFFHTQSACLFPKSLWKLSVNYFRFSVMRRAAADRVIWLEYGFWHNRFWKFMFSCR